MITNKKLLKLFDIKDDDVETFTVDNKKFYYEINIGFNSSHLCCPKCGSTHFISKVNKKISFIYTCQ